MVPPAAYYALLDEARHRAGRALDAAGLGPVEAPFRIAATLCPAPCGSGPTSRPGPPRGDRCC
jgi:hypothetical protein